MKINILKSVVKLTIANVLIKSDLKTEIDWYLNLTVLTLLFNVRHTYDADIITKSNYKTYSVCVVV